MGYRTYIGEMPKREYNKIKSLTKADLIAYYPQEGDEEDWHKGVYDYGTPLYEFGKYTEFDPPKKSMSQFFKKKDLQAEYVEDNDFYIVTKEFLAYIIEGYRLRVAQLYNEMVMPFFGEKGWDQSDFINAVKTEYDYPNDLHTFDFSKITPLQQEALYKMIYHVRDFGSEWTRLTPFDLEKGPQVTDSWKYEYSIFELVRIYKTFDWKKKVMIYYGY